MHAQCLMTSCMPLAAMLHSSLWYAHLLFQHVGFCKHGVARLLLVVSNQSN